MHFCAGFTSEFSISSNEHTTVIYRMVQKIRHPYCFSGVRFFGPPCISHVTTALPGFSLREGRVLCGGGGALICVVSFCRFRVLKEAG